MGNEKSQLRPFSTRLPERRIDRFDIGSRLDTQALVRLAAQRVARTADDTEDLRAPGQRGIVVFQQQRRSAFAGDEAVSSLGQRSVGIRPTSAVGQQAQSLHLIQGYIAQPVAAAHRQRQIRPTLANTAIGQLHRIRAAGRLGRHGGTGTGEFQVGREKAEQVVVQRLQQKEGVDQVDRCLVQPGLIHLLPLIVAGSLHRRIHELIAHTGEVPGADVERAAAGGHLLAGDAGGEERLARRGEAQQTAPVQKPYLAGQLAGYVIRHIAGIIDPPLILIGLGNAFPGIVANAAAGLLEVVPAGCGIHSQGRNHADGRDGHSVLIHALFAHYQRRGRVRVST